MAKQFVGALLGVAHTTPQTLLGDEHYDPSTGKTYMYMQADGAVIADTPYTYDAASFQIEDKADAGVLPVDGGSVPICFTSFALADNDFAWVFVGPGPFNSVTDATGVTAAQLATHISATVGTLSSGVTAALLKGVRSEAVIAAGATGTFYASNRLFAEDL